MIRVTFSDTFLRATGLSHTDISEILVEERVACPTRFWLSFDDPDARVHSLLNSFRGEEIVFEVDDHGPIRGRLEGSRTASGKGGAITQTTLYGYDHCFDLKRDVRLRVFAARPFTEVAGEIAAAIDHRLQFTQEPIGRMAGNSTITQYLETDFAFLHRLAFQLGMHFWPHRGTLYFGDGPGVQTNIEVDLNASGADGYTVESWFLDDAWEWVPRNYSVPVWPPAGAALVGETLVDNELTASQLQVPRDARSTQSASITAPGVVTDEADAKGLGAALAQYESRERVRGRLVLFGRPPQSLALGARVMMNKSRQPVGCVATVMGIDRSQSGNAEKTTIHLGRLLDRVSATPDTRPAKHLWPARITGRYDANAGTIGIRFVGWSPGSQDSRARIGAVSSKKGFGAIPTYAEGEWVLVGFVGGCPDDPIVISAFHPENAPDGPKGANGIFSLRVGNQQMRVIQSDDGLRLECDEGIVVGVDPERAEIELKSQGTRIRIMPDEMQLAAKNIAMKRGT